MIYFYNSRYCWCVISHNKESINTYLVVQHVAVVLQFVGTAVLLLPVAASAAVAV